MITEADKRKKRELKKEGNNQIIPGRGNPSLGSFWEGVSLTVLRKILSVLMLLVVFLAPVSAGWADTPETVGYFDVSVCVQDSFGTEAGGFVRVYDTAYREPELYLPIRFILERQGIAVKYDAATHTAHAGGYVFVSVAPGANRYIGVIKNPAGWYDVVLQPENKIIAVVWDVDHLAVSVEKGGIFYASSKILSKLVNIANFNVSNKEEG